METKEDLLKGLLIAAARGTKRPRSGNSTTFNKKLKLVLSKLTQKSRSGQVQTKTKRKKKYKKKNFAFSKKQYKALKRMNTVANAVTRTYYEEGASKTDVNSNQASYFVGSIARKSQLDNVYTDYKSVSDAGAVQTDNINTGVTYNTKVTIIKSMSRLYLRNNTDSTYYVIIYKLSTKKDTDQTPSAAIEEGLDAENLNASGDLETNVLVNPTDSKNFNDAFKIISREKFLFPPGASVYRNFVNNRRFTYTQESLGDNLTYVKGVSTCWLVKMYGDVAHDAAVPSTVGLMDGQVDFVKMDKYIYKVTDYQIPSYKTFTTELSTVTNPVQYTQAMEEATADV